MGPENVLNPTSDDECSYSDEEFEEYTDGSDCSGDEVEENITRSDDTAIHSAESFFDSWDASLDKDITPGSCMDASQSVRQDWASMCHPYGHILTIDLIGNHGNEELIGLNGLEVYDVDGRVIRDMRVHAVPRGIVEPSRLCNGRNNTSNADDAWCSPQAHTIVEEEPNKIFLSLAEPTAISMIKVWNYSPMPDMGAREIAVWMDSTLIYRGGLRIARPISALDPSDFCQVILFTQNKSIVDANRQFTFAMKESQSVVFFNNGMQTSFVKKK